MTATEFLELATKLRQLGAVKVRCGELEAVWSPSAPQPVVPRQPADPAALERLHNAIKVREREREIEAKLPEAERLKRQFERELDGGQS